MGWLLIAAGLVVVFKYTIWLNWRIFKQNRPRRYVSAWRAMLRLFTCSALLAGGVVLLTSTGLLFFALLVVVFALDAIAFGNIVEQALKKF